MSNATTKTVKILGINDDESTCACCGKSGLKRVVWLQFGEEGNEEVTHYGTSCAATALGLTGRTYTARDAEKMVADYNAKQARIEAREKASAYGQKEANRRGEAMVLCYDPRNRTYFSRPLRGFEMGLHGCSSATFYPAGA